MSIIGTGKISEFLVFIAGMVCTAYFLWRAMQGKTIKLRSMAMIEALPDVVDRAVETGRPIHCGAGEYAYLSGMYAPMTIAGMNILRYTARLCFRKGARLIADVACNPEAYPLMDGIVREAAVAEGRPEAYRRENIRWYGPTEAHWQIGLTGQIAREGVAGLVLVGAITGMTIAALGAVRMGGGLILGGTARYYHNGTWAALADYSLFSDDIYAAGAIASGDSLVMSVQAAGDYVKYILMAVTILFAFMAVAGAPVLGWLKI